MRQTDRAGFILEILQVIRKRRAKATNPVCEFVENYDSFLLVKFKGFFLEIPLSSSRDPH